MIATPGAVLFAVPVPKNVYANNTPTPGPGFGSRINRIDFPAFAACVIQIGDKIPWLIALFKNNTFAGSIKILANGINL